MARDVFLGEARSRGELVVVDGTAECCQCWTEAASMQAIHQGRDGSDHGDVDANDWFCFGLGGFWLFDDADCLGLLEWKFLDVVASWKDWSGAGVIVKCDDW